MSYYDGRKYSPYGGRGFDPYQTPKETAETQEFYYSCCKCGNEVISRDRSISECWNYYIHPVAGQILCRHRRGEAVPHPQAGRPTGGPPVWDSYHRDWVPQKYPETIACQCGSVHQRTLLSRDVADWRRNHPGKY